MENLEENNLIKEILNLVCYYREYECFKNNVIMEKINDKILKLKNKNLMIGIYNHFISNNHNIAIKYYELIIENEKNTEVMNYLGLIYMTTDQTKAEKYFNMAIYNMYIPSIYNLFILKTHNKDEDFINNFINNYTNNIMTMYKLDKEIYFTLGLYYDNIKKDYSLAEKYYLLSANTGYLLAQNRLGYFYEYNIKNNELAEKYYLMAASENYFESQYNLGLFYSKIGNNKLAEKYYLMAANNNCIISDYNLGFLYKDMKKYDLSEKHFLIANKKGYINNISKYFYGDIYQDYSKITDTNIINNNCQICNNMISNMYCKLCYKIYCFNCLYDLVIVNNKKCPLCICV